MKDYKKAFPVYTTLQNYLNEFNNSYTYFEKINHERNRDEKEEEYFFRIVDYLKVDKICEKLCSDYDGGEIKAESNFVILTCRDTYERSSTKSAFVITKFYFENKFAFAIVLNLLGLTTSYIQSNIEELKKQLKLEKISEIMFIKEKDLNYTHIRDYDDFSQLTPLNPFFVIGNIILKDTIKNEIEKNRKECYDILMKNNNDFSLYVVVEFKKNTYQKLFINIFSSRNEINFTFEYVLNNPLNFAYLDFIFNNDYDIQQFLKNVREFNIIKDYLKYFASNSEIQTNNYFSFLNQLKILKEDHTKINDNTIKEDIEIKKKNILFDFENILTQNEKLILELQQNPKFLKHAARLAVLEDHTTDFQPYLYRNLFQNMGLYDLFLTEKNIENFLTKLKFKYADNIELNYKVLFNNL